MKLGSLKWYGLGVLVLGLGFMVWREHRRADRAYASYRIEVNARAADAGKMAADKVELQTKARLLANKLASTEKLVADMRNDLDWLGGGEPVDPDVLGEDTRAYMVEALEKGQPAGFTGINVERDWVDAARARAQSLEGCKESVGVASGELVKCGIGLEKSEKRKRKWKTWALVATVAFGGAVAYGVAK